MKEINVDMFAGGGGASEGFRMALGISPDIAVNHCHNAILMHSLNHPETHHEEASVWEINPKEACAGRPVNVLWLSPDCRHFSRAKGSPKVSPRVRTLARVAIPWAKTVRPRMIALENVREFLTWGPLKRMWNPEAMEWYWTPNKARAGQYFRKFVADLEDEGYSVDWRVLNAADYGAPTARHRLFLIARRDGPAEWPEPTHGPRKTPHRTAAECIDWSMPVQSIFGRKKPLAEATQKRIAAGLVKFVLKTEKPFIMSIDNQSSGKSPLKPMNQPLSTITSKNRHAVCAATWIAKHYTDVVGQQLDMPLGTITAVDHNALCAAVKGEEGVERVIAWIERYYSEGGHSSSLQIPMPTITTVDRMSLIYARISEMKIVDIGMRMLQPHELLVAQGFPRDYKLIGTKTEQTARIGNSVPPQLVEAILRSNKAMKISKAA